MTTPLERLGQRVKERRHELRLALLKAAQSAPMSKDTWRKIERGQSARGLSYARIEQVLLWAPGSCSAILDGRDPIPVEQGAAGGTLAQVPTDRLESEVRQAVTNATVATTTTLTAGEIRNLNDQVVEELRRRGILPEDA